MPHRSMHTTWTASRQAGVAPASQYAASSAVRPSTWPSRPCLPSRPEKQVCHLSARRAYFPVRSSTAKRARPPAVLINAQARHRLPGDVSGVGGERLGPVVRSRRAKRGALPTAMYRPG